MRLSNPEVCVDRPLVDAAPNKSTVLREFFKRPLQTGALFASGTQLCETLVDRAQVENSPTILEIGAGTGVVTQEILVRKSSYANVLSIEINAALALQVSRRFSTVHVRCGNAIHAKEFLEDIGVAGCSSVVCSLPWANMSCAEQVAMLNVIDSVLEVGGSFSTFAYAHGRVLPQASNFLAKMTERFTSVECSKLLWANLPPAYVLSSTKCEEDINVHDHAKLNECQVNP